MANRIYADYNIYHNHLEYARLYLDGTEWLYPPSAPSTGRAP